jgi:hypothetical protein
MDLIFDEMLQNVDMSDRLTQVINKPKLSNALNSDYID